MHYAQRKSILLFNFTLDNQGVSIYNVYIREFFPYINYFIIPLGKKFGMGVTMKKRLLKIAAVSAAATLTLTCGVCSAVADNTKTSAPADEITIVDEQMMAANNKYAEAYNKAFEEALIEEGAKIDESITISACEKDCRRRGVAVQEPHEIARENAKKTAEEKSSAAKAYAETAIGLNLLGTSAYNHWGGKFYVFSVEETKLSFREPDSFNLTLGNMSGRMTATNGYDGNYKKCTVTLYFENGQVSTNTVTSNNKSFAVKADSKGPIIQRAVYEFTMYNGTGSSSRPLDVATVTLQRME